MAGRHAVQACSHMRPRRVGNRFPIFKATAEASKDPAYGGMRRFLLARQAANNGGTLKREEWLCNNNRYSVYRYYIRDQLKQKRVKLNADAVVSPAATPQPSPSKADHHQHDGLWRQGSRGMPNHAPADDRPPIEVEKISMLGPPPSYSFVGMGHIFADNGSAAITTVRFGHLALDLLAFAAEDGMVSVVTLNEAPEIVRFPGHSKAVTDLDWSLSNTFLASCSLDGTVRVWDVAKRECLRLFFRGGGVRYMAIRFHPLNNNLMFVGGDNSSITVYNFSTGRELGNHTNMRAPVTALDMDTTGTHIISGDAAGHVSLHSYDAVGGGLSTSAKILLPKPSCPAQLRAVTCVVCKSWCKVGKGPAVLARCMDGTVNLIGIGPSQLRPLVSIQLPPLPHSGMRAAFCPILSLGDGEYVVVGDSDATVYIYNILDPKQRCVNMLQGHGTMIMDVAWNYGENLLVSCDRDGVVIVWKRAQTPATI
eukprot:jgi/Mesvir1/23698/Mv18650-RA.1